jgi:parallel beta-helix repeat protein
LEDRSVPATFTVTKDVDDGSVGTFRWAINQANGNNNPGVLDVINFNIGVQGNGKTITLSAALGELPSITEQVLIDGFSQGGALADAIPWIELSGQNLASGNGLTVQAGGTVIVGLAINRFQIGATTDKGYGIAVSNPAGSAGCWVYGCYIGTDLTGTAAGKGNSRGILLSGSNNIVGDYLTGHALTVVSGNLSSGIEVSGPLPQAGQPAPPPASLNRIVACYVGLDKTGLTTLANTGAGIYIGPNSVNNTVGGAPTETALLGNVISGNGGRGVYISSSSQNKVINNIIGLAADGSTARGNGGSGVLIFGSTNNEISGLNIIAGNTQSGVVISGTSSTGNKVFGSFIGTNQLGTEARANGEYGVYILNAQNNYVGGTAEGQGNLISGNGSDGVFISGTNAKFNKLYSNLIGLNAAGVGALPNGVNGVHITAGSSNEIGAAGLGRNVISGNTVTGVLIDGSASSNSIVNCYIGTNKAGNASVGNGDAGIKIEASSSNVIGGTTADTRNVISGNGEDGIWITLSGSQQNLIEGNYIGLAVDGLVGLGNGGDGVRIDRGATNNIIGGAVEGARNYIADNGKGMDGGYGVRFVGAATSNNTVQGNTIGKNAKIPPDVMANKSGWQSDPLGLNTWLDNDHD